MIFQFNTNITEKDLYHFNMFHNSKKRYFWIYSVLFGFIITYKEVIKYHQNIKLLFIFFWLAILSAIIFYILLYKIFIPIALKVQVKHLIKKDIKNNLRKKINMTFEDDKLVISSKKNKSEISYESILKLEEDDKYFFIYTTPNQAILIKKDLFKDKSQIDEFRKFIKSKITS